MPVKTLLFLAALKIHWHLISPRTSLPRRVRTMKLACQLCHSFIKVGESQIFNIKDVHEQKDFIRIVYTSKSSIVLEKDLLIHVHPKNVRSGWKRYLTHLDPRGRLATTIFDGRVSKDGHTIRITINT
jgi:hypothetical protein